jgi:hypothetical protein
LMLPEGVVIKWQVSIPDDKIETYNLRLRDYFLRLEHFLREELPQFSARTIKLLFQLYNEGTAPAEGIRVSAQVPAFVDVALLQPPGPKWPEPPEPPKPPILEMVHQANRPMDSLTTFSNTLANPHRPVTGPFLRETPNGTDVAYQAKTLDHTYYWELGEFFATFPSLEAAKPFKLPYTLHASKVPEDVTGELHVVIKKLPR